MTMLLYLQSWYVRVNIILKVILPSVINNSQQMNNVCM